ncbi:MAG: ABC transporter permease, partial [Bdellovibrionales bacterium]|nr:ABC transporter permease [Bdellovibrionales bacterium]
MSKSLWRHALDSLKKDRYAMIALAVVLLYTLIALLSSIGVLGANWSQEVGASYAAPDMNNIFGTDIFGRSVLEKTIKGTEVAMSVGLVVALIAIAIGVVVGAIAGYFGGLIDELIVWFYTTFSSIPGIMLLVAITLIMGKGIIAV